MILRENSNQCYWQESQSQTQLSEWTELNWTNMKNYQKFAVIHTVKGFGIVNKAEIDAFLELYCFFDDPTDVGNILPGSSAFSKSSLNIWKFMIHVLLKPGLENFEHYFTSVWVECNIVVVWAFFGIAFLWDLNENFWSLAWRILIITWLVCGMSVIVW